MSSRCSTRASFPLWIFCALSAALSPAAARAGTAAAAVAAPAAAAAQAQPSSSMLPAEASPLFAAPNGRHQEFVLLTVDKNNLKADLKTWPEDPAKATTLRSFRIAVGKQDGDKQSEGDNRTPEGIYFAQSHIGGEALPEKYGRKAIPLDFPNPIDQIDRKTGHGIWLHGVDREGRIGEAKVTEGCVVFYNADIEALSTLLRGHQGVVVIAKDASQVNNDKDLAEVKRRTRQWMDAWSGRQLEQYIGLYAADFMYKRMDFKAYRDYKHTIFASYKNMAVTFDDLRVITHPKYAVAFFNQDFHGDKRYNSVGRKILYWNRDQAGQWQIKREVFENRRFESVTFTDEELALHSATSSGISDKDKKALTLPNL